MLRLGHDLGIDLGTANTLIYMRGRGLVLNEPSVVAIDVQEKRVLAVGKDAQEMAGKTPSDIVAVRPLRDGVVADFTVTEHMLQHFIMRAIRRRGFTRFRAVIGVPSGSTEVERRAVMDAALAIGARLVRVIEEPMAAAIGAGLPVHEPVGSMVVDIGGGTTDVAVISLGGIVERHSSKVAGDHMDAAITHYIRRAHNVLIGERTAERIKRTIGSAMEVPYLEPMTVAGRNLVNGLPVSLDIEPEEIRNALAESVNHIVEAVLHTLERTPPELTADIMERGIVLTGGGAMLHGLADLIAKETRIPTRLCDDPFGVVAQGTGMALEMLDRLERSNALVG